MEYSHEIVNNVLVLRLQGDLIGENHGPELVSIINDTINDNIVFDRVIDYGNDQRQYCLLRHRH